MGRPETEVWESIDDHGVRRDLHVTYDHRGVALVTREAMTALLIRAGLRRTSVDDADTIRDFAAFLTDPSSRCLICLTDDTEGASWRTHRKLGRVFICRACVPAPDNEETSAP